MESLSSDRRKHTVLLGDTNIFLELKSKKYTSNSLSTGIEQHNKHLVTNIHCSHSLQGQCLGR